MDTARIQSEPLLGIPGVWRTAAVAGPLHTGLPTGYAALDAALPAGGWPCDSVTELLVQTPGIGEIQLIAGALMARPELVIFIDPPAEPGAAALQDLGLASARIVVIRPTTSRDRQWATEQLARSGTLAAMLVWDPAPDPRGIRRLQLAAGEGRCPCFVFSPPATERQASPAAVRMHVRATTVVGQVKVDVFKRRGARISPFCVDLHGQRLARPPASRPRA